MKILERLGGFVSKRKSEQEPHQPNHTQWMHDTLLGIVGPEYASSNSKLTNMIKFLDLWNIATPDQRREFLSNTKASIDLTPELIDKLVQMQDNFIQKLPIREHNRFDDQMRYLCPLDE